VFTFFVEKNAFILCRNINNVNFSVHFLLASLLAAWKVKTAAVGSAKNNGRAEEVLLLE
jgi:hypothetical protein